MTKEQVEKATALIKDIDRIDKIIAPFHVKSTWRGNLYLLDKRQGMKDQAFHMLELTEDEFMRVMHMLQGFFEEEKAKRQGELEAL